MVAKKTDKSNLENKKFLFFEVGLMVAIALSLMAFEWSETDKPVVGWDFPDDPAFVEEWEVDITRPEVKKEIIKPQLPKIKIKPNDHEIPPVEWIFTNEIEPWEIFVPENEPEPPEVDSIFRRVSKMPRYNKGGLREFQIFVQQTVEYPQRALEESMSGKVFVQFVVNKKGYVTDIEVQKGIHPVLDNEVISAIEKSARWEPGEQRGIPVKVAMTMPVSFRLRK